MKRHDVYDLMASVKREMKGEYLRLQRRVTEDPGTAGDQGEENWADFLRGWLPADYHIVTKGRIINHEGEASPQVDILVLHPSYPQKLRNKKLYFAGGVIAVFECKLTLRKADVDKACKNAGIIKRMLLPKGGSPYDELHRPILFGLLAHSHAWKREDSVYTSIMDSITEANLVHNKHPAEMMDVVCIADSATYYFTRSIFLSNFLDKNEIQVFDEYPYENTVVTGYAICVEDNKYPSCQEGEIFCVLITIIFNYMAFEDPKLRQIASYIMQIIKPAGLSKPMFWDEVVLSEKVLQQLKTKGYIEAEWSKWAQHY